MSFLARLFGGKSASAPDSQPSSQMPAPAEASHRDPRHQLLRVALRATLQQHGIPLAWMGVEVLPGGTQQGQPALHLRLLVMHMDPRLLAHGLALEKSFREHLAKFDPAASRWLTGISWQFTVPEAFGNCT